MIRALVLQPQKYARWAQWLLLLCLFTVRTAVAQGSTVPNDGYLRHPRLGFTFISPPDASLSSTPASETRYRNALLLGAGWNRFPLYWNEVERTPGGYDWAQYDRVIGDDLRHGLNTNVILLGIPDMHRDGAIPRGLYAPVFADGTDTLAQGKAPNLGNPFARFAFAAVERYRPGGTFARAQRFPVGVGITVWEAWNEPDLLMFWSGSAADYARLLQVVWLAAHAADPGARVMFGGLAYHNPDADDYLARTMAVLATDPAREVNGWYMDAVAVHAYVDVRGGARAVRRAREVLARYGLNRPIWLNESGVSVWDDYPGATWTATMPGERLYRVTMAEQAAYLVQNTLLAWASGADVVLWHQLYDDCGNQAGGTDFAPDSGRAGDAYGIFRNERTSACYTQHPQPGTARPASQAFYRLAALFDHRAAFYGGGDFIDLSAPDSRITVVAFDRFNSGGSLTGRVYALWHRGGETGIVEIPAAGEAVFYRADQDYVLPPENGRYTVRVDSATALNPLFLVESIANGASPPALDAVILQGMVTPTPIPEVTNALTPIPDELQPYVTLAPTQPQPTLDPAFDTRSPEPFIAPLPPISPSPIPVIWGAADESGIRTFLVWVRVDGGEWALWQETDGTITRGDYPAAPGTRYEFALWAEDFAGNWSENVALAAMAVTETQP